jgi:hypothetical protein
MRVAVASLLFAGSALASDWYVDAVNGSDANDGQSPQSAWRTISHAVSQVPAGSERILIAPGTYNAALGESFPITPKPGHQLIGLAGAERPVITANGAPNSVLLRFESSNAQPQVFAADTRVEHLELRRATHCVELVAEAGEVSPTFVDVRIERMIKNGVKIDGLGGLCQPTLERLFIGLAQHAINSVCIRVEGVSSAPAVRLTALECSLGPSGSGGLALFGSVDARLERCNLDGFGNEAITMLGGPMRLDCVDSAISYSTYALFAGSGVELLDVSFTRCTIAEISQPLRLSSPHGGTLRLELDSSILATVGDSIYAIGQVTLDVSRSFISDGDFDGVNGCFSGDPGFRDASDGDFRLRWGSACIDAAPAAPSGARDVLGVRRDVDGNLDAQGRTDIGAYEFTPLEVVSSGSIGSSLRLDNWGPDAPSVLYWAPAGLASPASTPFGSFELNRLLARTFHLTTAGAATPSITQRRIPNEIALVGQTFSFQALTHSFAAPLSRAFTNGVEVSIVP